MWFTLLACQDPFAVDRHDLVGFRIAAISVPPVSPGEPIRPTLAMIVDGKPWSGALVDIAWFWVDGPDEVAALDPLSVAAATGPLPELLVPEGEHTLAAVARLDELEQRAYITLAEGDATFSGPTAIALAALPLTVDEAAGPELSLSARKDLEPVGRIQTSPGDFLRLTAIVEGDPLIHWMTTAGTLFELDRHTADWAAGDLILDEDEIADGRTTSEPGWVTFLALALGEPGETSFRARDVPVGIAPPGLWVSGRFVPTDTEISWQPGDAVRGTLAADDTSPFGLVLQSPTIEPAAEVVDYGTQDLLCLVTRDGPLDPSWWLTAVCARDGSVGTEVVVLPEMEP